MTKRFTLALFAGILFLFSFLALAEGKMIVRYGHTEHKNHPQHEGALAFAKYVNDKTGGEIEVQVFPLGQLGTERAMAEQVQVGTLQMTAVSASVLANFVKEVGIIEMPFIYPDRSTAYKTLDDKEVWQRLYRYCEAKGFVFIGYTEDGFRDLTNSVRPIRKPEDLKGLRIRVIKGPLFIDTFRTLGAKAVFFPFPEIYTALKQKLIDGQDNPLFTSALMGFPEVSRFATITDHMLSEGIMVVNKKFWDSLSPRQQGVLREAANVQTQVNREGSAKGYADAVERAKAQGAEVLLLDGAGREAFKFAVKPVYEKYRNVFGTEWFDFFIRKVESLSRSR
ncbi:MAG: C4-dicarboxylate ABC transporter substrate-binding protein [Syntrophus sp. (in: bacteria)]|nr:C4-dicarboxylate ABC transporter substrate-binding protein [Syntrophus sp. (in: bacteria)]